MEEELEYPEAKYLPVLYSTDKRGKERLWKTWTIGNTVYRLYGLVDGQKQTRKKSFQGVNKGKKNETSAEEQAEISMRRLWISQLDKNYIPKCKDGKEMYSRVMEEKTRNGGNNRTASEKMNTPSSPKISKDSKIKNGIIPMKASQWIDKKTGKVPPRTLKYFDFEKGVYVQWKLDGFRCIASLQDNGEVILTTNSGKQYPHLTNLREEIKVFLKGGLEGCDALDGELYAHQLISQNGEVTSRDSRFSNIQSICTQGRVSPHPLEDQICLYVFDLVDDSGSFDQKERIRILESLFKRAGTSTPHIKKVETQIVNSIEDVTIWHDRFSLQGFEGIIIRDSSLKYRPKHRALKMRKCKYFQDEEYIVVDTYLNSGVQKEDFVWVCESSDGKRFKAKPEGTREEKWRWYDNRDNFIGRRLTVVFQEYSSDGIPRFPIGKCFRESGDI